MQTLEIGSHIKYIGQFSKKLEFGCIIDFSGNYAHIQSYNSEFKSYIPIEDLILNDNVLSDEARIYLKEVKDIITFVQYYSIDILVHSSDASGQRAKQEIKNKLKNALDLLNKIVD